MVVFDSVRELRVINFEEVLKHLISLNDGRGQNFSSSGGHMRLHGPGRGTFYLLYFSGQRNRIRLRFLGGNPV
jgi:hypothetical protein